MYTNTDGLLSKKLELRDYTDKNKPDEVCITETKLNGEIGSKALGWENYEIWRKDRSRKKGGGVIILTSTQVRAREIGLRKEKVETMAVEVHQKNGRKLDIAVMYMPPQMSSWAKDRYDRVKDENLAELANLIERGNELVIVGDFNCKEVNWEESGCWK